MSQTATLTSLRPSPIELLRREDEPHADRAIRAKRLAAVARGVYADADAWRVLRPWERYRARVHATALRYPDAVFVLESAASLRGLPVFGEPADVHIAGTRLATSRSMSGVRVHTATNLPGSEEIDGLVVATPAEIAVDIARARHHAVGLAIAGQVLRANSDLDIEALRALNETRLSTRGRRHARWPIDRATGIPESTLEHVSLAVIEWLGFPPPELQKWILGPTPDERDRLDFWWEETRTGGEADGDVKYAGMDAIEVLQVRRARDARLLDRGVSATAHWGWFDASRAAPLRAALLAAGLRAERPENTAQLRSLTRLLTASPGSRTTTNSPSEAASRSARQQ